MSQRRLAAVLLQCENGFRKVGGYASISAVIAAIEAGQAEKEKLEAACKIWGTPYLFLKDYRRLLFINAMISISLPNQSLKMDRQIRYDPLPAAQLSHYLLVKNFPIDIYVQIMHIDAYENNIKHR
jgi:hypothetical protein